MAAEFSSSGSEKVEFKEVSSPNFKVGQVWRYNARSVETNSTLTVCKIEEVGKLGTVIHVSLADVRVKSPQSKDGTATEIAHLPFAESALRQSVTGILRESVKLPDFMEGYENWRAAVEAGKGGVWKLTVAEAIDTMERALNK